MEDKTKALYEFKKQVEALKKFRGRGTELVSVYISQGYPIHEIAGKLRDEYGQASNIKSKSTQKNVQGALERILNHLKIFKATPENGVALFAGNISEKEGRTDIQLFAVEPPVPLPVQFYRCESQFVTEPLEELAEKTDTYGLVVMDGKEATVALLTGKKITIVKRLESTAHQKVSKGGQCIHEEELVVLDDGQTIPIEKVTTEHRIATVDFDSQTTKYGSCEAVFSRTADKAYQIVTKNPRLALMATAKHRFFVITPEGIREKNVQDLTTIDRLITIRRLHNSRRECQPIEYSTTLGTPRISEDGRHYLLAMRNAQKLRQKDVASAIGTDQMSISELERGEGNFKVQRLSNLLEYYGINQTKFYAGYIEQDPLIQIPAELNEDLAEIIGYFTGDGTYDGNRIIFYDADPSVLEKIKTKIGNTFNISCKLNPRPHRGYHELRAHSKYLVEFLRHVFPETIEKRIPKRVLQSPDSVAAAFARGLFDAEGSASSCRVSIAMANKEAIRTLQTILWRHGIISSVGPKKARYRPQYYLEVNDKTSLQRFAQTIGFSSKRKMDALKAIMAKKSDVSPTDQIPIDGRQIAAWAKRIGLRRSQLSSFAMFLCGKRHASRSLIRKKVLPVFKNHLAQNPMIEPERIAEGKAMVGLLERIVSGDLVSVGIRQIQLIEPQGRFYDLTLPETQNFIINGIVVHNSAARYSRLHTEGVEYYYKRVGEAMDAFVGVKNFKGVIVGGPGPAKHDFMKQKPYNYQLSVLGVVDTGYTDDFGIREVLEKSDDIIAQQEAVVEKRMLDEFMREIAKSGLVLYGYRDILAGLEKRQIEKLLVSEGLTLKKFTLTCNQCGKAKELFGESAPESECSCGGKFTVKNEDDVLNDLIGKAESANVPVVMVSQDTAEGAQFYATFKGLGAFLRYK